MLTQIFLSTLSLRRATAESTSESEGRVISIHALLAESDALRQLQSALCRNFYPRSPCGERLSAIFIGSESCSISIHALLAESDHRKGPRCQGLSEFLSTLSLRRATANALPITSPTTFLSTLSLRRATIITPVFVMRNFNFYPRSPCGERR